MRIVQVQLTPWDRPENFSENNLDLKEGDKVIVKTALGTDLGEVVGFLKIDEEEYENLQKKARDQLAGRAPEENGQAEEAAGEEDIAGLLPAIREATASDLAKKAADPDKKKALDYCKKIKEKLDLPMKFIDAHFSFDNSRLTFAFIADGRVDFRELVKDLTRHFGKTIRLQQIGIRDEAKIMGDYGHCGRVLCCRGFLNELSSVTSEMSELQQCSHRGSERISGVCGRLMCCLGYEQAGYEKLFKKMPAVGTRVSVDGKRGEVVSLHVLKQTVSVRFGGDKEGEETIVMEVDLNRKKK